MDLTTDHDLEQFWLGDWIWELSANARVDVFRRAWFVAGLHNQQHVGVRKTSFLKFNHPRKREDGTKDFLFQECVQQALKFDAEHAGD